MGDEHYLFGMPKDQLRCRTLPKSNVRGLIQMTFGKISVIVTLGGGGVNGYDAKKNLLSASVFFI